MRSLADPSVMRPLAGLLTIFFLQQASGQFAVVSYATILFRV